MDVVVLERLTKRYGSARGIEEVSLRVRAGEVFGLLGPNGAGKTTTIRLLLGLLRPTSGHAEVLGEAAGSLAARRRTGYLPSDGGFWPRISSHQHLVHFAGLRGVDDLSPAEALAARLGLDLHKPVGALSHGNRKKLGLVQALMHDPELLVLDEPTSGLDPLLQQEFQHIVRERRAAGRTTVLSSHVLPEVESLCDRVAIVRAGRIVTVEPVDAIKARAVRRVRARFVAVPPRVDVPGVADLAVAGHVLTCSVQGEVGPLVRALATDELVDLAIAEPTLEDVFLGFYAEGFA